MFFKNFAGSCFKTGFFQHPRVFLPALVGWLGFLGCWFLTHLNYFWRVTWGLLAFRSPGFGGLGFGVWIWVSGFRGVWGLVLHRRPQWFARGLLARRRTTPKGDSPGGGFSPGGGHSTTGVQSKAVDQGIFWVFRVFRVCLVLHPGHRSGLPFFLHPRHRWIEAGNRCLAARVTH